MIWLTIFAVVITSVEWLISQFELAKSRSRLRGNLTAVEQAKFDEMMSKLRTCVKTYDAMPEE